MKAVGKRSGTEDRVLIVYKGGEPQPIQSDMDAVFESSLEIIDSQRVSSTVIDERLGLSVTVAVGIVMLIAFIYWAYAISLVVF